MGSEADPTSLAENAFGENGGPSIVPFFSPSEPWSAFWTPVSLAAECSTGPHCASSTSTRQSPRANFSQATSRPRSLTRTSSSSSEDSAFDGMGDSDATADRSNASRKCWRPKLLDRVEEQWSTTHKDVCTAVALASDGRLAASGGKDHSVRIMVASGSQTAADGEVGSNAASERRAPQSGAKVWTRVLQDHTDSVTVLAFSHNLSYLFSGGEDGMVNVYEPQKERHRRASHTFKDPSPILALSVHPSDTMLYVGTSHPVIRCYDVATWSCFASARPQDQHTSGVTGLACSPDGRLLGSCSLDGAIQIWDARSCTRLNRMSGAHSGFSVHHLEFSRDVKSLLSSGTDGRARMWDLRTGRQVYFISKAGDVGTSTFGKVKAVFLANDQSIAFVDDDVKPSIRLHNTATGELLNNIPLYSGRIMDIVADKRSSALMTAGTDYRCRYLSLTTNFFTHTSNDVGNVN